MKKVVFKVEGMHCEGCEKRIKNILLEIDSIKDVEANHNTEEVLIEGENINIEELKGRINDLGFTVKED